MIVSVQKSDSFDASTLFFLATFTVTSVVKPSLTSHVSLDPFTPAPSNVSLVAFMPAVILTIPTSLFAILPLATTLTGLSFSVGLFSLRTPFLRVAFFPPSSTNVKVSVSAVSSTSSSTPPTFIYRFTYSSRTRELPVYASSLIFSLSNLSTSAYWNTLTLVSAL